MDRKEAKEVLQALRPSDLTTDRPLVIEALVFAESDPEMKAWWEAQQAFDSKVAAKLGEVPVPSDLREIILAGRKIKQFTPQPRYSLWLAAAAVVAFLCIAGTSYQITNSTGPMNLTAYADNVLPLLNHDDPSLALTSPDQNKIMAWLKEQNAPIGALPQGMTALPTVGCQKFVVHGHSISLICFALAGGGIAHLFVVSQDALTDPPAVNAPSYAMVQGWATAAWSDGHMSYLMATQASPDALKQLL
jgi:anti-sigma factor RsiW